ncbi:MAG: hypothetical protein AB3N07_10075 [Ruegeria sp.]|uniref:hypothetical protein n=1 Tax=Ruegeria sp. ANG-S4 TaxID=1577904 RepID=UPI00057F318C|nr:hypothetical protein [Ruegeria sp. ANG-S4]KIC44130.1 hypothetical protein RA28_14230 [Ruegeria sp. ANG-S4]
MPERFATKVQPLAGSRKASLDERIAELRSKKPVDLNHGEALMLQGMASSSLRQQRISGNKLHWD